MTEQNPLVGKNVAIHLKTGMIKVGFLLRVDSIFITLDHKGTIQQIPLASIDTMEEARRMP